MTEREDRGQKTGFKEKKKREDGHLG